MFDRLYVNVQEKERELEGAKRELHKYLEGIADIDLSDVSDIDVDSLRTIVVKEHTWTIYDKTVSVPILFFVYGKSNEGEFCISFGVDLNEAPTFGDGSLSDEDEMPWTSSNFDTLNENLQRKLLKNLNMNLDEERTEFVTSSIAYAFQIEID